MNAEREREIRDARMAARYLDGLTYAEVGSEFGVHLTTARRGILAGLDAIGERERDSLAVKRAQAVRRYERWLVEELGESVSSRDMRLKIQRRLDRVSGVEGAPAQPTPNVQLLQDVIRQAVGK